MRIEKLVRLMRENEFDGALISPGTNLYHLTGLHIHESGERITLLVVNSDGEYQLLAPSLYENTIRDFPVTFWRDGENPYEKLAWILGELELSSGRILVENTMRSDWLINVIKLGNGNFEFYHLNLLMRMLRMRKDPAEIRLMERAAKVADRVFEEILNLEFIGMRERDLALKIELLIRELSNGLSFEPIVASGENGANPHHLPGSRRLRKGDFVIIDYGAKVEGYCSDITRTIALGRPNEKLLEIYEIVKDAQERAYRAVREGALARDVDGAARETIEKAGYGGYFTHRTGHGLGLDVHEEPFIGPDGEVTLREGMTFTIEPGVYVPGLGGVRIEDDVVVKEGRGKRLTKADRELVVL
ncbi:Xaa-Pro peptidase family protein [Thermococcus sp.]|uniref:M24 family metallopeptidase n=1 Tax=Thermococcus sp. TaxID=35749 RepID=UPI00261339A0|nr:aminopeptidase P family protein [Thermococcus sp.]